MARPRKAAQKSGGGAPASTQTPPQPQGGFGVPQAPAPGGFGQVPTPPAPGGGFPAPAGGFGQVPSPQAPQAPAGGFGAAAAPSPGGFGTAPAAPMMQAAQAAHPTTNPGAQQSGGGQVDLTPVLQAIAALEKKVDDNALAATKLGATLRKEIKEALSQATTTQPQPAPQQTPTTQQPQQPQPQPQQQAGGIDAEQVSQVVQHIRQVAAQQYATPGAVQIHVDKPEHRPLIAQVAIQSGAQYLQGANPGDPNLQQHLEEVLRQAGAVGPNGELLA